jgi:NAD(P)-dependent dehydrogenase (short-subunit alcohol dehydrogenase family)
MLSAPADVGLAVRGVTMAVMVITGTSSGIGLACATHFAARDHQVFATMRDTSRAGDLERAAAAAGVEVAVRQLDVDDEASVTACIDGICDEAGGIDALVNNASVAWVNPWEEAPFAHIEQTFRTNFFGAVRCARAVIPVMRRQGAGTIVNVTSVAAVIGAPIQGPYCATKAALASFSESLAIELRAHGIKVLNVMPGFTTTPILDKAWVEFTEDAESPYVDLSRRWAGLYEQGKLIASDPSVVAEAIEAALSTDASIHSFSGADAPVLASNWERIGDAGRLQFGETQTDEEWFTYFAAEFPLA